MIRRVISPSLIACLRQAGPKTVSACYPSFYIHSRRGRIPPWRVSILTGHMLVSLVPKHFVSGRLLTICIYLFEAFAHYACNKITHAEMKEHVDIERLESENSTKYLYFNSLKQSKLPDTYGLSS